jgi:cysteine-rich repeat protein
MRARKLMAAIFLIVAAWGPRSAGAVQDPTERRVVLAITGCPADAEPAIRRMVGLEIGDLLADAGEAAEADHLAVFCTDAWARLEVSGSGRPRQVDRILGLHDFPADAVPRVLALAGVEMLAALSPTVRRRVETGAAVQEPEESARAPVMQPTAPAVWRADVSAVWHGFPGENVGRQLVKVVGTAYGQIPVSDVQELVRAMEQANYFNLTASWSCSNDFPGASLVTTSLTVAGATHIVENENACAPTVLTTIEDRIDAVAHSAQWVKRDTPDGTCPVGATGGSADGAVPGTGDAGASLGTPKSFLIVNATAKTVYVDLSHPVQCRTQDASGWQACEFFGIWCLPSCQYVQPGGQCCVQCEQEVPSLFAVPAGGNRTIAWAGSLFAERTGYCSDCSCRQQSVVGQGTFEATVRAYAQYSCAWGPPCPEQADGTIPSAAPQGSFEEYEVQFAVPSANEVVVIIIPGRMSAPDAATIDVGLCGNGWLDPGEECDDGNTVSGDGCSASCQVEPGWH